jgi:hypothetical protein
MLKFSYTFCFEIFFSKEKMKKKFKIGKENEASFEIFGNIRFVEMGIFVKIK